MNDDPALTNALNAFVFSSPSLHDLNTRNNGIGNSDVNKSFVNQNMMLLEDLTKQLIKSVSFSEFQESLALNPLTTTLAIHAIGKASSLCVDNQNFEYSSTLALLAVEFLTTAFGYLEPDLVFTTLRLPILLSPSAQEEGTKKVTLVDVLAKICIDGTQLDKRNSRSEKPKLYGQEESTKLRVFAFMSLCRGIQAAEFIQRFSSSMKPFPIYPQDSSLGAGMGIGLDCRNDMIEKLCFLAVDYMMFIDTCGNDPNVVNCAECSDPLKSRKVYKSCNCESRRDRGYLFVACVVYLSTLLRSGIDNWLYFTNSIDDTQISDARQHTEQQSYRFCLILVRSMQKLEEKGISVESQIAAVVSVSLLTLIVKNAKCPLREFDDWSITDFYKPIIEHVINISASSVSSSLFALSQQSIKHEDPMQLIDPETSKRNTNSINQSRRAQFVLRRRALTAISDLFSEKNHIETSTLLPSAVEEIFMKLFQMCSLSMKDFEAQLNDPNLEGDLMFLIIIQTHCFRMSHKKLAAVTNTNPVQNSYSRSSQGLPSITIVRSLLRLCLCERYVVSAVSCSVVVSIIHYTKSDIRNDAIIRNIWDEIENVEFCLQEIGPLLVHILVFMNEHCDLKGLNLHGENNIKDATHEDLIGFYCPTFTIQIYRCEPRFCSIIDLFVFLCSDSSAVLQNIQLEPDFCNSTISIYGYISSDYVESSIIKSKMKNSVSKSIDMLIEDTALMSYALVTNIEALLTRLGHYRAVPIPSLTSIQSPSNSTSQSECKDPLTTKSLVKSLGIISTHHYSIDENNQQHGKIGNTIATTVIQGSSRDLIDRGLALYSITKSHNLNLDSNIIQSIQAKASINKGAVLRLTFQNNKLEEKVSQMSNELRQTKHDRDQLEFTLQACAARIDRERSLVKAKTEEEHMDLLKTHVAEREQAEKRAKYHQNELEKMERRLVNADAEIQQHREQLQSIQEVLNMERAQSNEALNRERNQFKETLSREHNQFKETLNRERNEFKERSLVFNDQISAFNNEMIQIKEMLHNEQAARKTTENESNHTLNALNNIKNDIKQLQDEKHADRLEISNLMEEKEDLLKQIEEMARIQKETQGKVEMTCFKLVALAKKYKDKEEMVEKLENQKEKLENQKSKMMNTIQLLKKECETLEEDNINLGHRLKMSACRRNESAIQKALNELRTEVPQPQTKNPSSRKSNLKSKETLRDNSRGRTSRKRS